MHSFFPPKAPGIPHVSNHHLHLLGNDAEARCPLEKSSDRVGQEVTGLPSEVGRLWIATWKKRHPGRDLKGACCLHTLIDAPICGCRVAILTFPESETFLLSRSTQQCSYSMCQALPSDSPGALLPRVTVPRGDSQYKACAHPEVGSVRN